MRPSTFPWIQIHTLAFFTLSAGLLAEQISYSDHCSSFVPEAASDINSYSVDTFPLSQHHAGYYSGNLRNILKTLPSSSPPFLANSSSDSSNHLTFQTRDVHETAREGVLKVEADLLLRVFNYDDFYVTEVRSYGTAYFPSFFHRSPSRKRVRSWVFFRLEGFWSETSGKLCMVGSTFTSEREGDGDLNLKAVLKMENVKNSANIASLFTGTLESLSSGDDNDRHFDSLSLLMFPQSNYQYSLVTEVKETGSTVGAFGRNLPVGLSPRSGQFCSTFQMLGYSIKLKHAANCDDPAKNCTPFGRLHSLPSTMSWRHLGCLESDHDRKVRVLVHLSNVMDYSYLSSFDPSMTLVGEGRWDERKNLLQVIACRIHTTGGSFSSAGVEDCSIELSFSFPATWSIKERNVMLGEIRSTRRSNESGYFDPIVIQHTGSEALDLPGLKYNYSEVKRTKQLCPAKKQEIMTTGRRRYPDRFSRDLSFDMSVEVSGGKKLAWGYSYPLFVGNRAFDRFTYGMPESNMNTGDSGVKTNSSTESQFNIAYEISLTMLEKGKSSGRAGIATGLLNGSSVSNESMKISAEGVYDTETGRLCMMGCRSLETLKPDSTDCEILIRFQFPPLDSKKAKDTIKGSIESMRKRSDPLYFNRLNISASAFYAEVSARTIWRLDLELSLVLISNTLSCISVGFQILYVQKHSQVLPYASLLMLTILSLGPGIPLVLNFEALFLETRNRQSFYLESGRWLEANEVLVRAATLVAFLFQFRLLQLSFSSRRGEGDHTKSRGAEKKALLLSLPLYGALKSYAGLVLDGFLLPQILLNLLRDSTEKVLSTPFYVGTTLVRLVPHGYDLWRGHNFVQTQFDGSYIYGTPDTDFYSTAWDVIIPFGGITFAAIVYLQQRFGGCCIIPPKFRKNSISYEKVPVVSDA
ncbi:hypothetical protein CRG98_041918 [Punica granatum]|uniref:RING-type E3 ubiquitin transferase n=1 Tax=Punica granatum TaxID=22663 RepID=A0A2I0I0Y7_PUNGR|nr:hypothetical protein CRG98_041918 [Punica granatum]